MELNFLCQIENYYINVLSIWKRFVNVKIGRKPRLFIVLYANYRKVQLLSKVANLLSLFTKCLFQKRVHNI